jgi:hypothetical protein
VTKDERLETRDLNSRHRVTPIARPPKNLLSDEVIQNDPACHFAQSEQASSLSEGEPLAERLSKGPQYKGNELSPFRLSLTTSWNGAALTGWIGLRDATWPFGRLHQRTMPRGLVPRLLW